LWVAFLSVAILAIPRYASAQFLDVDWKYYAGGALEEAAACPGYGSA
jgi:hypothetical protein